MIHFCLRISAHVTMQKKHSVPSCEVSCIANVLLLFGYLNYILYFKAQNEIFASQRALKSNPKILLSISLLLLVKEIAVWFFFFLIAPRKSTGTLDIDSSSGMEKS